MNRSDADTACQERGATLAVVRSGTEMSAMVDALGPWLPQVGGSLTGSGSCSLLEYVLESGVGCWATKDRIGGGVGHGRVWAERRLSRGSHAGAAGPGGGVMMGPLSYLPWGSAVHRSCCGGREWSEAQPYLQHACCSAREGSLTAPPPKMCCCSKACSFVNSHGTARPAFLTFLLLSVCTVRVATCAGRVAGDDAASKSKGLRLGGRDTTQVGGADPDPDLDPGSL